MSRRVHSWKMEPAHSLQCRHALHVPPPRSPLRRFHPVHALHPSATGGTAVLKWLLALVIGLVLIGALRPMLQRFGLGRLPGDFVLRWRGQRYPVPIASTLILSAILALLSRVI